MKLAHAPIVRRAYSAAVLMLVSTVTWAVRAQPLSERRALATELFKQGRELMTAGRSEEACPKLQESHRLDPGGGTVLNLALCYEAIGKLASAYSAHHEALALARRDGREDREKLATERLAVIEPQLSRLIIEVPFESDVPDLEVKHNGAELSRATWGVAIPVDGGAHRIEVTAPGRTAWSTSIEILDQGEKKVVRVTLLEVDRPRRPLPAPSQASTAERPLVRSHPELSSHSGQRAWGFVLGGVGLAALGAGTYLGLTALDKNEESERLCTGGCDARGAELSREASAAADWSTVSFALGFASLGVGTYFVLSAGDDAAEHVAVGAGPGTLAVRGKF